MFNFNSLMVADWITKSFPIIRIVLMAIILLCAIAVVVCIMRMESNPEGGRNAITGTSDSFYSQNQSSTKEGRLKRIVIICSIIIVVTTLLFFLVFFNKNIYGGV